jgi:sterol desaturase/sphingolipid hydroxylase (fatty acid hydroxylase superfamily)
MHELRYPFHTIGAWSGFLETVTQTFMNLVERGDIYLFLVPIYTLLLTGERLFDAFWPRRIWDHRDAAVNVLITVLTLGINVVVGHLVPIALMALIYSSLSVWSLAGSAAGWALAFLLYDLAWYTDHRIGHRVGFFWAMHQVHHSSEEYNMTVASRGFVWDITLLNRPTFYLLPLLGVSPLQFITISICTNVWGIAQHTRAVGRLKGLDWLLATPSNHRVHHGREPKYIDRNYGEVFMIWDHLFGTYQREEEEPSYGVTVPIETYNVVSIELAGIQRLRRKIGTACTWQDKLRCIIRPPEWKPPAKEA